MCGPKLPSTDRNCRSSSRNAVPMRSIWKNAAERKKATFHENGNYYCRNEVPGIPFNRNSNSSNPEDSENGLAPYMNPGKTGKRSVLGQQTLVSGHLEFSLKATALKPHAQDTWEQNCSYPGSV